VSKEDKIKWDKKYTQNRDLLKRETPSQFVKEFFNLAPNKEALDLACGGGRNTIFLAKNGFFVDAIDISTIALEELAKKANLNRVNLIEADLDNFNFNKKYGLIIKTNFLDRELINKAKEQLVSGGIFIIETYVEDKINQKPNSNPAFLLKKDELKSFFDNKFEILKYSEFENESFEKYKMKKAAIAVKYIG